MADLENKTNQEKPIDIQNSALQNNFLRSRKRLLMAVFAVALLIVVGILLSILLGKNTKENKRDPLVEQNERLKGFPPAWDINPEDATLVDARKKILEYATLNNIQVSNEEIAERQQKLIKESGEDALKDTLLKYGWSEDDWKEVIRWQLLREKILLKISPSRSGEVLSIRWDFSSPKLDQSVADKKSPLAKEFLLKVKQKLETGESKNLYEVFKNFDMTLEPTFKGHEKEYGVQYSGFDETTNTYKQFLITPESANYTLIMTSKIPSVTEIVCTMGGCQIYNIISGTNGDNDASLILEQLTNNKIFF